MVISNTNNQEFNLNGIDGQYFYIFLNEKLTICDSIAPTESLEHVLRVVEEPIWVGTENDPSWLTMVVVYRETTHCHYHPKKYMIEKTKYTKIQ